MKKICVIGSLNVDLTIRMDRFHLPGETITGESFDTYAGGKGGNQAVAAAKLGATVLMVGKLGDDAYGAFYRDNLEQSGVLTALVETVPHTPSGIALIEVDGKGENRIIIVPGANALVDEDQIDRLLPSLLAYDIFLLQLEIPMDTVCYAAHILHKAGKCVILDPAPAVPLPDCLLEDVDYITPNVIELSLLASTGTVRETEEGMANTLLQRGARAVIAKLGDKGCLYVDEKSVVQVGGFAVPVVDTTAAGDSFNAALAVALAEGKEVASALRFANAAGALSVAAAGAQSAMPCHADVETFLADQMRR